MAALIAGLLGAGAAAAGCINTTDPILYGFRYQVGAFGCDTSCAVPDTTTAPIDSVARGDTVWVLHAPAYVDRISVGSVPRPAAIISGHTHGGQVRLPFYAPYTPYGSGRFVAGWYRDTLAPLYVSRGIGTVSLPVRLFCPPELAVFTLRRSGER